MLYIVRGKSNNNNHCLRVHADSAQEAEKIGWKRGLFVTEVQAVEATTTGRAMQSIGNLLLKAWRHTPANALKAWGRSVPSGQVTTLVMLAMATWAVDVHALRLL